ALRAQGGRGEGPARGGRAGLRAPGQSVAGVAGLVISGHVPYPLARSPHMSQRTLVILKPDAVRRGLVGEILSRIERKDGWRITAMELRTLDRETLEQHYAEHVGRPFYGPLLEFMASGPWVVLVVEGER